MDSTSFPSGGRKIYHERSAIGDMLSAIQNITMRGLVSVEAGLYSYKGGNVGYGYFKYYKEFCGFREKAG